MTIENFLKQSGLTDTETRLYLAGIAYTSIGVSELVKITGIQRTTIYHALETLEQKGLVAKKHIQGRMVFSMAAPQDIEHYLDRNINSFNQKKVELKALLPTLESLLPKPAEKTIVRHFEGLEGIKAVVDEALYCKSRTWDIIAPVKNFFYEFDKSYANYFLRQRELNNIKTRSLWERDFHRIHRSPQELAMRNPKILPEVMHGKFQSVIIIFDDKVAIISSVNQLSAILISSKEINETMKAIFEGLWINAQPY